MRQGGEILPINFYNRGTMSQQYGAAQSSGEAVNPPSPYPLPRQNNQWITCLIIVLVLGCLGLCAALVLLLIAGGLTLHFMEPYSIGLPVFLIVFG